MASKLIWFVLGSAAAVAGLYGYHYLKNKPTGTASSGTNTSSPPSGMVIPIDQGRPA